MKKLYKIEKGIICLFLFLIYAFLCMGYYILTDFNAYSFEEIAFFLSMPIGGIDFWMLFKAIRFILIYPALLCFVTVFFAKKTLFKMKSARKYCHILLALFIVIFLTLIYGFISFQNTYYPRQTSLSDEEEIILASKENIRFPFSKRNLIVIFLESFEQTFQDKAFFKQSLVEPLEKFEEKGISFAHYQDGFGMTPSMPSLIAFYTGLPVFNTKPFSQKLPFQDVYSLGKILKDAGYYNMSLIACKGTFEGGRKFFENNGMYENIDWEVIDQTYPQFDKKNWGYADKDLFWIARQKIMELENKQPFFFLIQTMDTHANYFPPSRGEDRFEKKAYNIIYNTAMETANFLSWLENQKIYEKTTIVVLGDHLRKGSDIEYPNERNVYNLFINAVIAPKNKNRTLNQIDLFPSVLEAIGVKIKNHKLGLGTSVFFNKPTLAEQYSSSELEMHFKTNKELINLIKGQKDD